MTCERLPISTRLALICGPEKGSDTARSAASVVAAGDGALTLRPAGAGHTAVERRARPVRAYREAAPGTRPVGGGFFGRVRSSQARLRQRSEHHFLLPWLASNFAPHRGQVKPERAHLRSFLEQYFWVRHRPENMTPQRAHTSSGSSVIHPLLKGLILLPRLSILAAVGVAGGGAGINLLI
jgi:hypothetical protein